MPKPRSHSQASAPDGRTAANARTNRQLLLVIAALLLLTLCMFGDVLVSSDVVVSNSKMDLVQQGILWREFGFDELRSGDLPLWNPHIFLGIPFLGGFQSALFYPLNWIYLVAPVGPATNWLIAGHIFLSGVFMSLWAWRRGLHPLACLVAGALLMFCGPQFLRVQAGHLPPLLAMPWIPLFFLAIDDFFKSRRAGWVLVGMAALAMAILAGHPQYFFYALIAATIYCALLMFQTREKMPITIGLVAMVAGAFGLTAAQLLPGLEAAGESIRSVSLPYKIASSFSLPPENLITLAVPGFFGDGLHVSYWGRWNMAESSAYIGACGLVLAIYGAVYGERSVRRFSITMVMILLVLALGNYTPLFQVLYATTPNFDKLRSISRFAYLAAMFACMLAGIGLDQLIRRPSDARRWAAGLAATGAGLGLAAAILYSSTSGAAPAAWWVKLVQGIWATLEISLSPALYSDPASICLFGRFAALGLAIAAITLLALAACFAFVRPASPAVYGIAFLTVLEVFTFSWTTRDTFQLSTAYSKEVDDFLAEHPGDYRIFSTLNHNRAMGQGAYELWGYDSLAPMRLAELMAYSQGQDPEDVVFYAHYPSFRSYQPIYQMLRLRYLFQMVDGKLKVHDCPPGLPHVQLAQNYRVLKDRNAILAALSTPSFDPRTTVILEEQPGVKIEPGAPAGTATVVEESTDSMVIEAHLPAPAILLVTDGWSKNWRAESTKDEGPKYRVMPADYVLRAIPLTAGDHSIRLEYRSNAFTVGKWVSIVSLVAYGIAIAATLGLAPARLRVKQKSAGSGH